MASLTAARNPVRCGSTNGCVIRRVARRSTKIALDQLPKHSPSRSSISRSNTTPDSSKKHRSNHR